MKHLVLSVLISVYIFLLLGFALHTSPNPVVFAKYTVKYAVLLAVLAVSIIPLLWLYVFTLKTTKIHHGKKKLFVLTPKKKLLAYIAIAFSLLICVETFLRLKHLYPRTQPYTFSLENIHPFLQGRLTTKNNEENPNLNINSYGFRGEEMIKEKPAKTFRVFFLGGSTVLNNGVAYEQSAQKLLQDQLQLEYPNKRIEILNAGMDGYTSEHVVIQYAFYIKDFQPDLLIAWHGINDLYYSCTGGPLAYGSYQPDYSHNLSALSPILKTYYAKKNLPISLNMHLVTFDFIQHFFRYNLYSDINPRFNIDVARALQKRGMIVSREVSLTNFPSLPAYERNLHTFIQMVQQDNVPFILGNQAYVYRTDLDANYVLPHWYMQTNCAEGRNYPNTSSLIHGMTLFNKVTQDVAKKDKVPFVDFESQLPKTFEYFTDDTHYTALGNAKISDILFSAITKGKYIK